MQILTQNSEIELLLTDIIMPGGLNGVDLGRQAKDVSSSVKLMYMSGFPQSAFGDRAQLEPGVTLMRKPFRKAELALEVRKVLDESA